MCGRFTITRRDGNSLAAELGVPEGSFVDYRPRYNIAPTQPHFIVRIKYENREVLPATWGLVRSGSKDASMAAKCINARSETIETRPAFRDAFQKRRCVVPADGFFEWTGPKTARQPTWFHREDSQPAAVRRTLRGVAERAGRVGDDVHDSHDGGQRRARVVSRSHAGDTGRSRRRRLDGSARAVAASAQALAWFPRPTTC